MKPGFTPAIIPEITCGITAEVIEGVTPGVRSQYIGNRLLSGHR
jgi:hypothetical protein